MKSTLILPAITGMLCALCSCGSKSAPQRDFPFSANPSSKSFAEAPVSAERVVVGSDTLIVGRLTSSPETVTLLASELMDDLEIVKLENTDEALVGGGSIWVNDSRIIIYDGKAIKQFDRSGKFLGNIGAKGQGPGEYSIAPYYITVDEAAGRIYLLEYAATNLKIYDTTGVYVGSIPFPEKVHKGFFRIDNEKGLLTVASLRFSGMSQLGPVWVQDFHGNVVSSVNRPEIAVEPDYSNEVYGGTTADGNGFTYSLFRVIPEADSLYVYADSCFRPDFTFDFGDKIPMHTLQSLPQFYVVIGYGAPVQTGEGSYQLPHLTPFVIDRYTLRGAPAVLMLDNLGTLTMDRGWSDHQNAEYFSWCIDPGDLLDCLEAAPESHPLANEEGMKRMRDLKETINLDDNNYIIIGKWKR
ncbi:MAG: 6-bladed beta-propeller [Paramuribaculum sp.]|nr:6-bladed beta-propeller [Paramuribaculum sp.]